MLTSVTGFNIVTFVLTETLDKKRLLIICFLTLFLLPLETEVGELTEGKTGVAVCETVTGVERTMVWIDMGSV